MSFKIKPTKNNPNPIEFKKESKHEHSEDEIEILEQKTRGQYNNKKIEFKREPINNNHFASNTCDYSVLKERIKQLESENKSLLKTIQKKSNENDLLKFKMDGLCETVEVKSNKIIDLKLKLKRYETNKNNQTEMKTRDYVLSNKMVNYFKSKFFILNYCLN